ncbi:MAG TPA: hypothetical protein VEF71_21545 [Streptosporangiaceae bacterium]|nr:hypothetical protein [Streptosporangiaceae bacterium]
MILVAGLAIAGLAGIAAFYYSMRPGRSRLRAGARPGRSGAAWFAGVRDRTPRPSSPRAARSSSSARSPGPTSSRAAGRTGPEPVTGSAAAGPRTGPGEDSAPPVADRRTHREASTGPRRRVAWRKGADVDQELWPIEAFGGVSDEQFWDDLAADKPLATTARAAQTDSGARTPSARSYPVTRPAAADRPTVQLAAQSVQAAATSSPMATQAYPARTYPSPTATQPVRAAHQPTGSRGRRSAAADGPGSDEDPLTSPAYSLRPKGAVGGRSYQSSNRSTDLTREQTDPLRSGGYRADPLRPDGYSPGSSATGGTADAPAYQPGPGSAVRYGGTAARPYPGQPHSQSTQPAQSVSTPPYGDMYGYRNPADPADDPRRANGNGGHGRPGGNGAGEGNWGSYRAHPAANGYRGPYDRGGRR